MKLKITSIILIAFLFVQCRGKEKNTFTVTINYKNADKLSSQPVRILLEEVPYGRDSRSIVLDSGTLTGKNGTLLLKGYGKEEGVYELQVQDGPILLLINDEADITVDIDLIKEDNYYSASGTPASSDLKTFIESYSIKSVPVNQAFYELDSLKKNGASDSLVLAATAKKN